MLSLTQGNLFPFHKLFYFLNNIRYQGIKTLGKIDTMIPDTKFKLNRLI